MWQIDAMRVPTPPLLVTMVVAALSSAVVHGEATSVRVHVEQLSSNRTRGDTRTETRSMKLSISNVSAAAVDLKIRYLFIGRDLAVRSDFPKGNGMCGVGMMSGIWPPRADAVIAGKGEQAATVKSGSAIIVETPAATAVSTLPRLVNGRLEKGKGNKFLGYAVRVYRGAEVLAEVCEPGEFAPWAFFQQPFRK